MANTLYYGDNLDILRRYIKDESVDLVYLDPPFNSNASYNVLFAEQNGTRAAAQIKAFEDTWRWDQEAARTYFEVVEQGGRVSEALQAFRRLVGESTMLAYLSMMAPRLVELRRVLKPTGSIYLHCDPTASHYLKLLMDAVFGPENYRNEIVWKRTTAHGDARQGAKHFGRVHDVLLRYSKTKTVIWNPLFEPYEPEFIDTYYKFVDEHGRRYWKDNLTAAKPGGNTRYPWRVKRRVGSDEWQADIDDEFKTPLPGWEYKSVLPPERRYWAYSRENMIRMAKEGRLVHSSSGMPTYKRYLDEMPGRPVQDWWDDIRSLGGLGGRKEERLGYPTQKPEALLERIIKASSNEGDVVLDPFCGCGTAIAVAHRLNRQWIGIDITYLAIALIRRRLRDQYGEEVDKTYTVIGEPVSLPDAQALAANDPYQFQWWALDLLHARPADQKKGADKGIDGRIYFHEGQGETKQIIISVKAGRTTRAHVYELRGVVEREKAAIGVLISMQEPTGAMREEAASAGFYESPWGKHPRIQLITVAELLAGKKIDCPPQSQVSTTFKKAPRHVRKQGTVQELPLSFEITDE